MTALFSYPSMPSSPTFTVISGFAELEREQISENVRAGMARARAQGKQISRPRIPEAKQKQIHDLAASGKSKRAIARELGVNRQTVTNYLRQCPPPTAQQEQGREGTPRAH